MGVSVRLNQAIRQHFQNIVIHSFEFPGAWVDTSRLVHHLLWLLTGISEGKILFLVCGTRDLLDVFQQSIVISFIHCWYIS